MYFKMHKVGILGSLDTLKGGICFIFNYYQYLSNFNFYDEKIVGVYLNMCEVFKILLEGI